MAVKSRGERARILSEQLRQTIESQGFKILWAQYEREVRRAEKFQLDAPRHQTTDETAMDVEFRKGFRSGVESWRRLLADLQEELSKGDIPWERNQYLNL